MDVKVVDCTEDPVELIGMLAGVSRGKTDHDPEAFERRTRYCIEQRHDSVLEHVSATFHVDGISRACSHQLVRHRLASFVEKSQRYGLVDTTSDGWFVKPPTFEADAESDSIFCRTMGYACGAYINAIDHGVPPEDARYLLPEATKTSIVVTVNLRELDHMRDVRCDGAAQWEIRELVDEMWWKLSGADGWYQLLGMLDKRRRG